MKMKKLQQTFKKMSSRERRNLQQLEARGVDEFARKELRANNWRKQYRSNLLGFLDKLSIKPVAESELVAMRTTIVETILAWGDGQQYYVDQFRKKRNVTP